MNKFDFGERVFGMYWIFPHWYPEANNSSGGYWLKRHTYLAIYETRG